MMTEVKKLLVGISISLSIMGNMPTALRATPTYAAVWSHPTLAKKIILYGVTPHNEQDNALEANTTYHAVGHIIKACNAAAKKNRPLQVLIHDDYHASGCEALFAFYYRTNLPSRNELLTTLAWQLLHQEAVNKELEELVAKVVTLLPKGIRTEDEYQEDKEVWEQQLLAAAQFFNSTLPAQKVPSCLLSEDVQVRGIGGHARELLFSNGVLCSHLAGGEKFKAIYSAGLTSLTLNELLSLPCHTIDRLALELDTIRPAYATELRSLAELIKHRHQLLVTLLASTGLADQQLYHTPLAQHLYDKTPAIKDILLGLNSIKLAHRYCPEVITAQVLSTLAKAHAAQSSFVFFSNLLQIIRLEFSLETLGFTKQHCSGSSNRDAVIQPLRLEQNAAFSNCSELPDSDPICQYFMTFKHNRIKHYTPDTTIAFAPYLGVLFSKKNKAFFKTITKSGQEEHLARFYEKKHSPLPLEVYDWINKYL